jgi:hypothetical protein
VLHRPRTARKKKKNSKKLRPRLLAVGSVRRDPGPIRTDQTRSTPRNSASYLMDASPPLHLPNPTHRRRRHRSSPERKKTRSSERGSRRGRSSKPSRRDRNRRPPSFPLGRRRVVGITASVAAPRRGPAAAQVEPTGAIACSTTSPASHGGRGALPSAGGSPSDLLFLAGGGRVLL